MQFGKVFISSLLDISESEFYKLVIGKDLGGIDKKDAYKQWLKSKPKKLLTIKKQIKENEESI
jgi:hypothetical protein